jgi:hypothetical protein
MRYPPMKAKEEPLAMMDQIIIAHAEKKTNKKMPQCNTTRFSSYILSKKQGHNNDKIQSTVMKHVLIVVMSDNYVKFRSST